MAAQGLFPNLHRAGAMNLPNNQNKQKYFTPFPTLVLECPKTSIRVFFYLIKLAWPSLTSVQSRRILRITLLFKLFTSSDGDGIELGYICYQKKDKWEQTMDQKSPIAPHHENIFLHVFPFHCCNSKCHSLFFYYLALLTWGFYPFSTLI